MIVLTVPEFVLPVLVAPVDDVGFIEPVALDEPVPDKPPVEVVEPVEVVTAPVLVVIDHEPVRELPV